MKEVVNVLTKNTQVMEQLEELAEKDEAPQETFIFHENDYLCNKYIH